MRKLVLAVAALAVALAVPAVAAEQGAQANPKAKQGMKQGMKQNPELKKQLMSNPHHVLARAHLKSVKSFAHGLKKAAKYQETLPADLVKTSVSEMKRNLDEAEKHHKECVASLSEEMKAKLGDMPKKMEEHLANARTHLGHLEQLAGTEKVDSKEVLKHLGLMMQGCEKMEEMHEHGRQMKGKKGRS